MGRHNSDNDEIVSKLTVLIAINLNLSLSILVSVVNWPRETNGSSDAVFGRPT